MKYKIRNLSWSKRRKVDPQKEIENVKIENFKKEHNHFCTMKIKYKNDNVFIELNARVLHNTIKDSWILTGLNSKGDSCTLDIIEF